MVKALDRQSSVPLHTQAELALRVLVAEHKYQRGALLPDEMTLARELGISRNTLRTALARLVSEGILERRQGAGTRVKTSAATSTVGAWVSFTLDMARKGIEVQTFEEVSERHRAADEVAKGLHVSTGTPVLRLDRLRGWNGLPAVHFRSYLHPRLGLEPRDDFSRPLFEVIAERCKIQPAYSEQEILAVEAEAWVAERLMVEPGSPILLRRRLVYDRYDQPMELGLDYIRSDRFTLTMRMTCDER